MNDHAGRCSDPATTAAAIVLAGGRSQRLGGESLGPGGKAAVALAGRTFLEAVCDTLAPEVARVIVVAAPDQKLPAVPAGVEIVRDGTPGEGPLAGLRDGLRHLAVTAHQAGVARPATDAVVVCSCDVPLLRPPLVRRLVARLVESRSPWAVPVVAGHPQVLVSAVRPAILPRLEAHLAAGRRDLRGLLETLAGEPAGVAWITEPEVAEVDPGLESFLDVDTPADLDRLSHHESRLRRRD